MRCPRCEADTHEGMKFCIECAAPLTRRCPQCAFANPPQAKFCGQCAASLSGLLPVAISPPHAPHSYTPLSYTPGHLAEKILTSKAALEGERKQVTVLFADLKGSMELLADRDPEDARAILDPVLERMMAAVHRYEGTVNQVMGDGIMALFGAPIAHEDHAVRACYAALAMQASVHQYAAEVQRTKGVPIHIRVGLNAGEVVVRSIGSDLRMDYSAIGQTTHLAARMEQLATPGSIRLTAATLRLVEGLVQVMALGPVPVKGLAEPVEVFELVAASALRRRLQAAAARGLSPFVGRQAELAALQQALERARPGHGQVVAAVGEAGIGKSRLVYEFLHSHRTQGWQILESSSVSYGKATAYLPVCDLLKAYCHVEDRDDLRTVRAKLTGQILTLDDTLQDTVPAVLALFEALPADSPFLSMDPLQRRRHTLEALKRILLRESQVQPLLLVFEDLHWIDSETQAVLDTLVDSLPTARVLLLVNYRHEYQHSWGSKTFYTQLRLDPLPEASAETLLQTLLGDEPGLMPLTQLLIARTQGNPFFLEESVRTLVETRVLMGDRGAYHLAAHVGAAPRGRPEVGNHRGLPLQDDIQIPATVQALRAARIDRLPPEDKHLLQTAAVIGTEVPWPLLQAIADTSEEALFRSLAQLRAAEFLYEASLFPERAYTFKHALTHEVAYGRLLHERRRALHIKIVDALEALSPDRLGEYAERLAHHALRGEMWDKALAYSRQAGKRAQDRGAFREAVTSYDQALDALDHLPESPDTAALGIELRRRLGGHLSLVGEQARSLALLGEAEARARQLGDRAQLGEVLARMVTVRWIVGDFDGALAAGLEALELAVTLEDPVLHVHASYRLGQVYTIIGDYSRAAEVLRRNVEALPRSTPGYMRDRCIASQAWLAGVLSILGEFVEGRRYGEEALRLAMGDEPWVGDVPRIVRTQLGWLYLGQGDQEAAIRVFEEGLALCRVTGQRVSFGPIAGGLGEAYAHTGRLAEGLALLEEVHRHDLRTGALGGGYVTHLRQLSAVYLLAGRLDEAWQHACRALDLARQQKTRGEEVLALYQLGAVHAHASPPDVQQAEARYREALMLAEALGMRPLQAHCHRGLGTLYAKIGRREQAHTELSTAIELYRAMAMTFWLPQAEAALARVEGR